VKTVTLAHLHFCSASLQKDTYVMLIKFGDSGLAMVVKNQNSFNHFGAEFRLFCKIV